MKYKRPLASLIAALAFGAISAGTAQANERVVLGEHEWDGAVAIMQVLKTVLADRLKSKVDTLAATQEVIAAGLDKGDGSVDVFADLYMPNRKELWDKYIAKGSRETILTNSKPYQLIEGIYVPGYVQDKYNVRSVSDLLKPDIAALFDTDNDGKGEIWAGPTGWGSTNIMLVKAKSYGFDKTMTTLETSDAIMKASLKAAHEKQSPVVFYFWEPESIFAAYDIRKLEEPAFDGYASDNMKDDPKYKADGCWKMYQPKDRQDWFEASDVKCAWPDSKSYVLFSKSLETRAPRAAKFLSQVYFKKEWVSDWILKMSADRTAIEAIAKQWVDANPAVVDEWVKGID